MKKAVFNRETLKIELHFDKADYIALSDSDKSRIKSAFLWSTRRGGCWVSRCKEPNLYTAKRIAADLGFGEIEKIGERLTFGEQVERAAEKAEARAERYETHAENAEARAEKLQKPLNDMHGDIAFFTQPNINTSAGRAFTRLRERMYAAFDRGIDEYRKSTYWKDRAETARETAAGDKYNDRAYLDRRIRECRKGLKQKEQTLDRYNDMITKIINCENVKTIYGQPVTFEQVEEWANEMLERAEAERDKLAYLLDRLEDLGGIQYSRENIKPGYIVRLAGRRVKVVSAGSVNFQGVCIDIDFKCPITYQYAEIIEVLEAKEKAPIAQPFKVGEIYPGSVWNPEARRWEKREFKIIKATDKTVTLQCGDAKPFIRKPSESQFTPGEWVIQITDSHDSIYYKRA